jgi:DNA-binding IclR family transcriptional regulator
MTPPDPALTADDSDEAPRDRRFATTLAKGLQILQAFSASDRALGNRELARRTGMPPSTVARMTFTLTQLGFLQQIRPEDSYRLGPAVMALGYTARAGLSFLPTAEPVMQQLADEVGALVALAVRDGDAAMLTRCWRPRNTPTIWLTEGHRLPLERSSPGRAILAASPRSNDDDPQVRKDRSSLQSRGFVVSLGHWNEHINACAVPFWPEPSQGPAAFLCGAGEEILPADRLEKEVGPLLLARVRELETQLGLSPLRPI